MNKNKIAWVLCICLFTFAACTSDNNGIGNNEDDLTIENVDIKSINQYDTDTNDTEKIKCIANNDYFFQDINAEYKYSVIEFLYEDIEEVPVAVKYITSYEKGDVYSISINYDEDCDGRYHWGNLDRFDVGMFYVTDESIYVLLECEGVPTEDDFLTDGDIVYSSDDSETVDEDGYIIDIKNDGDYCLCRIYNPSQGSTFYWNYGWTKGKGLTYFRSGYGAEGDPIEIELKD